MRILRAFGRGVRECRHNITSRFDGRGEVAYERGRRFGFWLTRGGAR